MSCPTKTQWGDFYLLQGDTITDSIVSGEGWDLHVVEALAPHIRGGRVLDIGANIGFLTCRFVALGASVVEAVEPSDLLMAFLKENTWKLNGLVRHYQYPLYSMETYLAPDMERPWCPSSIPWLPRQRGVLAHRGDDVLGGTAVTAIKVDTQGADLHVLLGLEKTIERWRPAIAFEYEEELAPLHKHSWPDYLHFFRFMNYALHELRVQLPSHDYLAVPR